MVLGLVFKIILMLIEEECDSCFSINVTMFEILQGEKKLDCR